MRKERITQNRVIQLMVDNLGYRYIGNLEDQENTNLREADLKSWLSKQGCSQELIGKALFDFKKAIALNPSDDLYATNKEVYELLRYGLKVKDEVTGLFQTVMLVDWKNPDPKANDFAIAEEVTVRGENTKRPDIVIYVNGIALGVLELKRASVHVSQGIRQNLDNQQHRFIKPFFTTIQTVLAGNDTQGLHYGTIKTPEKFYLRWKEDGFNYDPETNLLDQHILQFCEKGRYLELIHDFVVFDSGIKKLCRPNQYFGVKAAQKRIEAREGGIIWHTQGSGKSILMVWIAKWIRETQKDARLLIITDRTELDEQIEKVFSGVNEQIYRAKSGRDLLNTLNAPKPWLVCSLIHKFGSNEDDGEDVSDFLKELDKPADFSPKGNLFVFIDECHRTQSGELHDAMKELLPDAMFIGFTGTPLLKTDKKKSIEVFGTYIHTYKFNEAVKDGVVLDLLYEARDVDQKVTDQNGIDVWFDVVTAGMNDLPKAELKQKWGTLQKILSTRDRLQKIVWDIYTDFKRKPRLKDGRGNAILVTKSIYEACRYYEIFQQVGFKNCAIITSFEPNAASIKGETTGDGETEKIEQYEIYQRMLDGKDRATFEKEAKKKFIEQPANMQLLIVVQKLLTGFDAPNCTYLYIDKEMRDHGLFQAICRVNRTADEDKQFGYIVDYMKLFDTINNSIHDYTSDAFDQYEEDDIKGLLVNRLEKAKECLEDALETVHEMTKNILPPKQIEQFTLFFGATAGNQELLKEHEEKRLAYYKAVVALIRAYNNIAPEMKQAGYSDIEAERIKNEVNFHVEMRNAVKIASGDEIDLKKYEPDMRQLLDQYLSADPSRVISNFGDASLLEIVLKEGIDGATEKLPEAIKRSKEAVAETLEANMRKVIIQEMPINPAYYEKMSVLLNELVKLRKESALKYEDFLKEIEELAKKLQPENKRKEYPKAIDNPLKQAVFEILKDEELTLLLEADIRKNVEDDFIGNTLKERKARNTIRIHVKDADLTDEIFEVLKNQREYR